MKNEIKHTAHSSYRCEYHIVFAPKYRRKVIYKELRKDIGEILRKQLSRLTTIEERLHSRLTDEDKHLFEKYRDACMKFNSTSCADSFLHGFRLGGKIAIEMLDG